MFEIKKASYSTTGGSELNRRIAAAVKARSHTTCTFAWV